MSYVWVCKGCLLSVGINPDKVCESCIGKGGKKTCDFCGCIQDGSWFSFNCFDSSDLYNYALELIAELKDKTKELDEIKGRKCANCYHNCSIVSNYPGKTVCMLHGSHRKLDWCCSDWRSSTGE